MVRQTASIAGEDGAWGAVLRLTAVDGTAAHPWTTRLMGPRVQRRDLSDAVHALCMVHGGHPGMADGALARPAQPDAAEWLTEVAEGFTAERAFLAQLTAAAGPLPSTPGQAGTEAALVGQRHALDMLARSDRGGCATGAVAALLTDWSAIRNVLERAAILFGITVPPTRFPLAPETATIVATLGASPACERAITFGAQQLLAQHRGLWSLLEARAHARDKG